MPMVSIRPGYVTLYSEPLRTSSSTITRSDPPELPTHNRPAGLISFKAERRLSQAIDWMLYLAKPKPLFPGKPKSKLKFRVNFITLTLSAPQVHDDNTIKKELLQPFLDTLRKSWKCSKYLWRAEAQANGNIHFHIVSDVYVEWWKIRNRWNAIQGKLGYVARFHEKHGHSTPNSTDVHSVNRIKNLAAYLAKYCSKNPQGSMYTALSRIDGKLIPCYDPSLALSLCQAAEKKFRAIGGKLWGLSYSLSRIRSVVICTWDIADKSLREFCSRFKSSARSYDYHTCYYVPVAQWAKAVQGALYTAFQNYLAEYRGLHPPRDVPTLAVASANNNTIQSSWQSSSHTSSQTLEAPLLDWFTAATPLAIMSAPKPVPLIPIRWPSNLFGLDSVPLHRHGQD